MTKTVLRTALGAAALALGATAYPADASPMLNTAPMQRPALRSHAATAPFPYAGPLHAVRGMVRAINGTTVVLQTRGGTLNVDAGYAMTNFLVTPLTPGRMVVVHGVLKQRTLVAHDIAKEQVAPGYWPADR